MINTALQEELHDLTNMIIRELIMHAPASLSHIHYLIQLTDEGIARHGLADGMAPQAELSECQPIADLMPQYTPLAQQYVEGWKRSHILLDRTDAGWNVTARFEADGDNSATSAAG